METNRKKQISKVEENESDWARTSDEERAMDYLEEIFCNEEDISDHNESWDGFDF